MEPNTMSANSDEPEVYFYWSARKVRPIVLLYVAAVFVVFILVAYFVLHSMSAVKALAMAAVASMVPLVPVVTSRVEYRLNERVLERRPKTDKKPKEFEAVFQTVELASTRSASSNPGPGDLEVRFHPL